MANTQDSAGMDIRVHPLVVMSIADHHTRNVQQYKMNKAIGAVFGVQTGRVVHVYDTFEIGFNEDGDEIKLELGSFQTDLELYKEAYPNYECLGWYRTGPKVVPADTKIHEQLLQFNDRPLFILLNPTVSDNAKELPLSVYEEDVHVVDKETIKEFVKTSFKIHSDEAERISAVHCAKVVVGPHQGSSVTPHYTTIRKAVATLRERVQVLHTFLRDVSNGKIQVDHNFLRSVRGICNRLPSMDSKEFDEDFMTEYNDALMVTYLAAVTKSSHAASQAIDKFNLAYGLGSGGGKGMLHGMIRERGGGGGGARGPVRRGKMPRGMPMF